jgi:capsular polysaccharide biosynthesis protein
MKIFKSFLHLSPFKQNIIFEEVINNFKYPDNFNKAHQKMFFNDLFNNKVGEIVIFLYKNVIISNSIIFKGFAYSDKSTFHTLNGSFVKPSLYLKSLFKILFRKKIFIKEGFLASQEWGDNFYHFTLELLPQIISFSTQYPEVPIIMPLNYKSKNFITGYLSILGISPIYYDIKNVVKIEKLFVSEVPRIGNFNKKNILNLKESIEVNALLINYKPPFRNVYLSRSKANRRKIINESVLISLLEKFGFEIYYAEDLEFSSKIQLFTETKVLISNHGAGFSNIVHLQTGQTIIELKAFNDNYWTFFSLSRILDHKYYYLFSKSDSNNYRDSNIDVDLKELELLLNEII